MANSRETMNGSIEYLSKRLAGYCIFINDKHKLLVIAPQKCGSTSIFKSLYDSLVEPSREYEKTFSHEYTKELCIHMHLKFTQDSSTSNLKRIFADESYKKILAIRDPIDRLCSSICSKYLLESTPFYQREIKNKRINKNSLFQPYTNTDNFLDNFNEIANILLTKGSIFKNEKASHASPISEIVPKEILPFFDKIDITNKEGWTKLKKSINQHLRKHQDNLKIEDFPHVNESPLNQSRRFLSRNNITIAYGRYSEDYINLQFKHPDPVEHEQSPPSIQELKSLNTFISLANRSADLFNIGNNLIRKEKEIAKKHIAKIKSSQDLHETILESLKDSQQSKLESLKDSHQAELESLKDPHQAELESAKDSHQSKLESLKDSHQAKLNAALKHNASKLSELTIKNEQLIVLEELSRRTAEELLIESHGLKELNSKLKKDMIEKTKEEIKNHPSPLVAEEISDLDLYTLTRRAEKRIRNKNFRSAVELLNTAYFMDKKNRSILLRLWAVSSKNQVIRSLMLWITPSAKSSGTNANEV